MADIISALSTYTKVSPCKSSRTHAIDSVAIHCMAGNMTAKRCVDSFANKSRKASSNYAIGSDGATACSVPENYRSWCTSNTAVDNRSITIEVANDGNGSAASIAKFGYAWHCTDQALVSLINLLVDICRRNNIPKLVWSSNKTYRMNRVGGANMYCHRDYANKACPGDYIYSKEAWIAQQVNTLLGVQPAPTPTPGKSWIYKGVDYRFVFEPTYYANANADLKQAFGNDANKLFNHFCSNGMSEKRIASADFNVNVYVGNNADLGAAFGYNWPKYYEHYCVYGRKENRVHV